MFCIPHSEIERTDTHTHTPLSRLAPYSQRNMHTARNVAVWIMSVHTVLAIILLAAGGAAVEEGVPQERTKNTGITKKY